MAQFTATQKEQMFQEKWGVFPMESRTAKFLQMIRPLFKGRGFFEEVFEGKHIVPDKVHPLNFTRKFPLKSQWETGGGFFLEGWEACGGEQLSIAATHLLEWMEVAGTAPFTYGCPGAKKSGVVFNDYAPCPATIGLCAVRQIFSPDEKQFIWDCFRACFPK